MTVHLLIVDDERIQRLFMSKMIEKFFPKVIIDTAENGNEAIEKVVGNGFNVIFMDLTMPMCDGFTATRTIRLIDSEVLIFPITAFGNSKELKDKCLDAGMNGYYTKPLTKKNLMDIFQKIDL